MEFFVVDPKEFSFPEWKQKIREFLRAENLDFVEEEGKLFYKGDDIAMPWGENSLLFQVNGGEELRGVIELREEDEHFYVFSDDMDIFDDREVKEAVGLLSRPAGALYGFSWRDKKECRFHLGPSAGFYYFYDDEEGDYPPVLDLPDVWELFFRAGDWIGNGISRIQDLKGVHADDVRLDLHLEFTFKHPAALDALNEVLCDEEGFERTKTGLRAVFRDRHLDWLKKLVALLPPEEEDFERAFVRAVWSGAVGGKPTELFYVGIERRRLRPFVQLPVHGTSKDLVEKFRNHFKGHRMERQEYYL
jgi:hypothetical protein